VGRLSGSIKARLNKGPLTPCTPSLTIEV